MIFVNRHMHLDIYDGTLPYVQSQFWHSILSIASPIISRRYTFFMAICNSRDLPILGCRQSDSPRCELFGRYLILSLVSSHPLRHLLDSRLRLCVLCAQMSMLDKGTRHQCNCRYAGVHYKHIP
jgi:hypothetical protein